MLNPSYTHNPDEFTLKMKVGVERLLTEIILSQPVVDTRSEEPGTLLRPPTIGTGSDEPGVSRTQSMEKEEIFPLETSIDGFLHSNCTSSEQECILLQPDVGVDDEKETTTTTQEAAVREEFARPTKKRQQQKTTAWTNTNQSKQFDRGRSTVKNILL